MKIPYKHTIFRQLVIFSLLISVVPVILIAVLLYVKMENKTEADLSESHVQIVSQYRKNIKDRLEHYQMSIRFVANNTSLVTQLINSTGNTYRRGRIVSEEVTKSLFLKETSEIRNCMVYSEDEENPIYGTSASMMSAARQEPWYTDERMQNNGWFTYWSALGRTEIFSFVQTVQAESELNGSRVRLGSVKLDINLDKFLEPAANRNYYVFVYDDDNHLLYASDKERKEAMRSYLGEKRQETAGETEYLAEYKQEYDRLEEYGLNILFLFENSELKEKKEEVLFLIVPVLLVVLLVILCVTYLYTRHFSARIGLLVKKFKTAETGNLALQEPIKGNDEIAQLDKRFSHMLTELDTLIQKNYVEKLERRETQFRNLQLQINPHFLYNTLETISALAAVQNVFDVCEMCQKLGEIFRYSIGKNYGEYVTVEQELHHTKNYIFIQKMRYGNRFEAFFNIETDISKQVLPRFILQPIVENAIIHGWGELMVNGTLEISVYNEDGEMFIKIEDDGVGMPAEKVEELSEYINNTEDIKDSKKSIGIRNVNQRIKLACGEAYGVMIESEVDKGSRFIIKLPLKKV